MKNGLPLAFGIPGLQKGLRLSGVVQQAGAYNNALAGNDDSVEQTRSRNLELTIPGKRIALGSRC